MSHIVQTKTYYQVFAALMVLLVLTVLASYIPHDLFNTIAAVTIALTKAVLIVLFFMHVKYSGVMTRVIVVSGVVWLFFLFALLLSDYETRGWSLTTGGAGDPASTAPLE